MMSGIRSVTPADGQPSCAHRYRAGVQRLA